MIAQLNEALHYTFTDYYNDWEQDDINEVKLQKQIILQITFNNDSSVVAPGRPNKEEQSWFS